LASSSIPRYPSELLWNGRQPDQVFDPDESLFYRVNEVDHRGKVGSVDVILCPNTSVNRGKYSKPVHVLYAQLPKFLAWKVMEFRVRQIPLELEHPDRRVFRFELVHDPVRPPIEPDENYAHSEIRAFHQGQPSKRLPGLVEKKFRQVLADFMELVPQHELEP
jgi:hypothetical protein